MRYLLDSLLAGYPVGTLLVCSVQRPSSAIRVIDGARTVVDADPSVWQLLDGQQRINALYSIFTPYGRYGSYFLHMGVARPEPRGPSTRRRARDEGLAYIHWVDASEADSPVPDRAQRINLSRWYEWAESDGGRRLTLAAETVADPAADLLPVLNEIDPDFADDPEGIDMGIARGRLDRLISLWRADTIPVEYRPLASPMDVLEVFTRVNRAGVQVAGQDLFFAAVKTLWPHAESVVADAVASLTPRRGELEWDPLVDRMTALRLLARLSSRALDGSDLLPLVIDRLIGNRGGALIAVMQQLADPGAAPLTRMHALMGVLADRSTLGFGLYQVDSRLWDHVLAWAAVSERGDDDDWLDANVPHVDAYLLGATAFRYSSTLGDRFGRDAFSEAIAAGAAGEPFPTARMPAVARRANRDLRGGRDQVRGLATDDDKLHFADANAALLLSVVQRIEFRPQRGYFDWDHIYPQAKASLMWTPGADGRWRRHHRYRRFVGSAGNLWALDYHTNRAMQDRLPHDKFAKIRDLVDKGEAPILGRGQWWLTDAEIEEFSRVGKLLKKGAVNPGSIDRAMSLFHRVTVSRALAMVDAVVARSPESAGFALDADVLAVDPRTAPSIAAGLRVVVPETSAPERARAPEAAPAVDLRVQAVLEHADDFGCGPALRRLLDRVTGLGLQVRGYKYCVSVTPPRTRSIALITLTPRSERDGRVTTWTWPPGFVERFPDLPAERFEHLNPAIRGAFLGPAELEDLGDRLEAALGPAES